MLKQHPIQQTCKPAYFSIRQVQVGTSQFADEIGKNTLYKYVVVYFDESNGKPARVCPEDNTTEPTQLTGFLVEQSDMETANYLVSLAIAQGSKSTRVTYQCVQLSQSSDGLIESNAHFAVIRALNFIIP